MDIFKLEHSLLIRFKSLWYLIKNQKPDQVRLTAISKILLGSIF